MIGRPIHLLLIAADCDLRGFIKAPIRGLVQASNRLPTGAAEVTVNQRTGELLLPACELEPVRLELVATRAALVQRLPLCDERAKLFL
jgi:hypothetical protein